MEVGTIGNDGVMIPYITNNHEIWAVCPVCGTEYDRRMTGECPECAARLAREIRRNAHEHKRTH